MDIAQTKLVKMVGRTAPWIARYLCRPEFTHIVPFYIGHERYYQNISKEDIALLKEFKKRNTAKKGSYGTY